MLLNDDTKSYQEKLAQFTRDGELVDIKGVKKDRLHHYRRLTFNIQLQTMEQAFPIAYSLFNREDWKNLVHEFFNHHDPQTPQIWKLPFEFYQFVQANNYAVQYDIPFLNDLLHFEWIEIEVHTMADSTLPSFDNEGDILNDVLIINPEYRLIKLDYPVHKRKPSEITSKDKGSYFLLIYRDLQNGAVHFMDLSVLHTFTIEKILAEQKSLASIALEASEIFSIGDEKLLSNSIVEFGNYILEKNIALGYQK